MSVILGASDGEKVIIGADSGGILASFDYEIRKDSKVFIKNDDLLFGFAGSFRVGQLVKNSIKFEKKPDNMSDHKYLCTMVANEINSYLPDLEETNFIIGYRGNIYTLQTDFQVSSNTRNFDSIGAASPFALSSYYLLNEYTDLDIEQKVQKSLEISTKFNLGALPPFKYVSSKI